MTIFVRKWGNSAAVRLPATALAAAGIAVDDPVDVREEAGRIVIKRARAESVTLEWLLADISADKLHEESDFGPPQGKEAW